MRRVDAPKRGSRRRLTLLALGLTTSLTVSCNPATRDTSAERPPPPSAPTSHLLRVDPSLLTNGRVKTAPAVAFAHAGYVVVPGEVTPAPDGEAEVGSLVAGRIASVDTVAGATVKKGQILAWIDAPEIGSVRADLARSAASVVAAQQRLDRQLALQLQGATSQGAVDDARAAWLAAKADQQGAHAKLGAAGVASSGSTGRLPLRSPIDGVVVERHATLGGAVAPDTTLFRIINPHTLRVKAQWSETLGPIPSANTPVTLSARANTTSATHAPCEASILTQLPVVDPLTRSVTLQIEPGKDCAPFTAGGYVDARILANDTSTPEANWVQVPLEAVVDLRGLPTVFVANAEVGVFEARTVEAKPSVGNSVPIALGLRAGESVAVEGVILLKGEALGDALGGE